MDKARKIRVERKKKLKRVFNYDAEMAFLEKFWELKKKENTINEFKSIVKITLIDTKQISETIAKYFIEELYVKEQIEEKRKELNILDSKRVKILNEISELEDSINDDDDDDSIWLSGNDPCSPIRSRISSC